MGGPVLADKDRPYRDDVKVPLEFWKVLFYSKDGQPRSKAFILTQELTGLRALADIDLSEFKAFEMTLAEIGDRTKLSLSATAAETERRTAPQATVPFASRPPITDVASIGW
jgi:endonuclease G, mitochondrial